MAKAKVMIGFKTDIEVREQLEKIAEIEDRSISYIVNRFVKQGLENYKESMEEEAINVLEILDYIKKLDFKSYNDFLQITAKENTYDWVMENLGALQAYMVVCEKLNIPADQRTIDAIEMQKMMEESEDTIE